MARLPAALGLPKKSSGTTSRPTTPTLTVTTDPRGLRPRPPVDRVVHAAATVTLRSPDKLTVLTRHDHTTDSRRPYLWTSAISPTGSGSSTTASENLAAAA
jgi:hypothetical protein